MKVNELEQRRMEIHFFNDVPSGIIAQGGFVQTQFENTLFPIQGQKYVSDKMYHRAIKVQKSVILPAYISFGYIRNP